MKNIIGIGNALVDALVQVENDDWLERLGLPKGSMQLIDFERFNEFNRLLADRPVKRATGGSVANAMLALARLGAQPAFVGKWSDDDNGCFFADNARRSGIRPLALSSPLPTGVATTFITPDGQRTFGTYLGAAATMTAADLTPDLFAGHDLLFVEGYLVQNHALVRRAAELAKSVGLKIAIDLASYNIVESDRAFFAELLSLTDIVFANEEESFAFTGKRPEEALAELSEICEYAVVKTGQNGSLLKHGNDIVHVPALTIPQVVDTTGAGDYFAAGFLYGWANAQPLSECGRIGTLLAAHVCQVVGTTLPETTWQTIRTQL